MTILFTGVYFAVLFLRASAPRAKRINWAVGWLSLGIVGNVVLLGYQPFQVATPLGDLNAVWAWACFILATVEGFLAVERVVIQRQAFGYLFALVLFYLVNLLNYIRAGQDFSYSFLYLIVLFPLIYFLGPTVDSFDSLRIVGVLSLLFIFFLLLTNYNSPTLDQITGRPIAGVSAPEYRNFVWSLFGLEDRFRGPFGHPNQLGIFCAFFATVLATSDRKIFRFCSIGFLILTFCAASRTSMLVASVGILLSTNKFLWTTSLKNRARIFLYSTITISLVVLLLGSRYGSGRLVLFKESFSNYPIRVLFGSPSYYVENTFLRNLFGVGLVALLVVIYLNFKPIKLFWKLSTPAAKICLPISIQLVIASMGESVVQGATLNSGTLYLLVLTCCLNSFSRRETSVQS